MRDNLELVARPEGVLKSHMDNGLVWLTAHETPEVSPVAPPQLANPLPYTLLVKGRFWYFRHTKFGTVRLRGEYRDPEFMRHYGELLDKFRIGRGKEDLADVYFIGWDGGPVKIGVALDPVVRLTTMQSACPYQLRLYATVPGGRVQERVYHRRFASLRMRGEWFDRAPAIADEIARLSGKRIASKFRIIK